MKEIKIMKNTKECEFVTDYIEKYKYKLLKSQKAVLINDDRERITLATVYIYVTKNEDKKKYVNFYEDEYDCQPFYFDNLKEAEKDCENCFKKVVNELKKEYGVI